MDEISELKEMVETFKETLTYLIEQEEIRGKEVSALNEKINAVNDTLINQIINPSIEAFKQEQFDGFKEKYGERLGQYDDKIKIAMNDPEYDSVKEAWDAIQEIPEEDKEGFDEEAYVADVEKGLAEYVDNIKKSLGLAEDTAVEITDDGNGEVEVKADTDDDGEVDTVVETNGSVVEEDNMEIDPELQKQLEEYLKK